MMSGTDVSTIICTTSFGLDQLLGDEITRLVPDIELRTAPGMVQFEGTIEDALRLCMWSRLANRVIWQLAEAPVNKADDVYALASTIDWTEQFAVDDCFAITFKGTNRAISNSQYGAQLVKDAIVDCFKSKVDRRPSVYTQSPDFRLHARLRRNICTLGVDLSGESLHRRHYRQDQGEAPLKEHVACAMLIRSGWSAHMDRALIDPMCGSGTIAIEAALMATNRAPGLQRSIWGFSSWLPLDNKLWEQQRHEANEAIRAPSAKIFASDNDRKLLGIAKHNADAAEVFAHISFDHADALKRAAPDVPHGYLVSNPPYGERLGELAQLVPLFEQWGTHLKESWKHWNLAILSNNRQLLRTLKLRANKTYAMHNGKLECSLVNYQLDEENTQVFSTTAGHPFANRIGKNLARLRPWLKKQHTNCYRIYDADLPEYNVAIDRYGDYFVVQEYAPPKTIDSRKSQQRLQEVLLYLPVAVQATADKIILKVREQQRGSKQYERLAQTNQDITVYENQSRFRVNLWDYLDTGLFLDHRETRKMVQDKAAGKDVLNLFSYTGSVSVAAALGGARSVTSVDLSKNYLDWAKRNFELNNIQGPHAFIQADCSEFFKEHSRQYDLVFIDPPSFSNSKKMRTTWDVDRDHTALLIQAKSCLTASGEIVFSTNKRGFKLDTEALVEAGLAVTSITHLTQAFDFRQKSRAHQSWIIRNIEHD